MTNRLGLSTSNLNFEEERSRCLRERVLFEDQEFPAEFNSLFPHDIPEKCRFLTEETVEWLRPAEIVTNGKPEFISEGTSRFDVNQGVIGDCYMLAVATKLAMFEELFYRVVPADQSFTRNYAGIFHFKFWDINTWAWVDVVIDDRLPTFFGRMIFARSSDENEFWSVLMEKAYAKFHGSYRAIISGPIDRALREFTGASAEVYLNKESSKESLFSVIKLSLQMRSMVACGVAEPERMSAMIAAKGLFNRHAYSVTAVSKVHQEDDGEVKLLRIRNPHGNASEWDGPWGDKSEKWDGVQEQDRKKLQKKDDGEFWISLDDFVNEFTFTEICTPCPEGMDEEGVCPVTGEKTCGIIDPKWQFAYHDGDWCPSLLFFNQEVSLLDYPQYLLHLPESGKENLAEGQYNVVATMMIKYRPDEEPRHVDRNIDIYRCNGFASHRIGRHDEYDLLPVSCRSIATDEEVTARASLEPGFYLITLSSFPIKEDIVFLLRILVDADFSLWDLRSGQAEPIATNKSEHVLRK